MTYTTGFLIWLAFGLAGGFLLRATWAGPTTTTFMSAFFGVAGAAIGGLLGVAPYVAHDPSPLRFGAILGALVGAFLTPFVYHLVARKAL